MTIYLCLLWLVMPLFALGFVNGHSVRQKGCKSTGARIYMFVVEKLFPNQQEQYKLLTPTVWNIDEVFLIQGT